MEVRAGAGVPNPAHQIAAGDTVPDAEREAVRGKVAVKGVEGPSIREGVADHQGALVGAPTQGGGVADLAVADRIEWLVQAAVAAAAGAPPVLAGVMAVVTGAVLSKIPTADGDPLGVRGVHGKVEDVDDATKGARLGDRVLEQRFAQVARERDRPGG